MKKLSPIMVLLYYVLKMIVRVCLFLFYPNTRVTGKEYLKLNGPLILISNHPNTLTDALLPASRFSGGIIHFLANVRLFKSQFQNWFFSTFYCIPIERPQDIQGRSIDNSQNFEKCNEFLSSGGCLYVAVEGGSEIGRKLRKLKTGTARLSLDAERTNHFELNLRILPIGINYSDPFRFGSSVLINVGKPVLVDSYKSIYEKDSFEAAKNLTQDLSAALRTLLLDVQPEEEEGFHLLEVLIENQEKDPISQFNVKKEVLEKWRHTSGPIKNQILRFFKNYDLDPNGLSLFLKISKQNIRVNNSRWIILFLTAPLFVWGFLNNILPSIFPLMLLNKMKPYPGYNATFKIVGGLFLFPLFYLLQTWIIYRLSCSFCAFVYFFTLLPSGIFAFNWMKEIKCLIQYRRFQKSYAIKIPEMKKAFQNIKDVIRTAELPIY